MEGTNLSYIKPLSQKAQMLHTKALLMEGNTIHNFITTKKALSKGKLIFKCMIRGASLTSPYTQLDILFLPPVAPIFSLLS